jgi:hypothetical protein
MEHANRRCRNFRHRRDEMSSEGGASQSRGVERSGGLNSIDRLAIVLPLNLLQGTPGPHWISFVMRGGAV